MAEEIWKEIPGYEGLYMASNFGNIYSVRSKKRISASKRTSYMTVCLTKDGKQKCFGVHRLVAMAFIPNPENKPQVNHISCDTHDNRAENLEWVTRDENLKKYWDSDKYKRILSEQRKVKHNGN